MTGSRWRLHVRAIPVRGLADVAGRAAPILAALLALSPSSRSEAAPGQALRLGGAEAQGPATRAVTALHHNPAMLATAGRSAVHVSGSGGLDQTWIRRNDVGIDPTTGGPIVLDDLQDRTYLLNPTLGYFVGASLFADPFAIAAGIYDLSSRYRFYGARNLRHHLAPDPELPPLSERGGSKPGGCIGAPLSRCPPNGGAVEYRQDLTLALAYNGGPVQLGFAAHMPFVRTRFALDEDVGLWRAADPSVAASCQDYEDPRCAERVGFRGVTQWIPRNGAPPGFDAALTFGLGATLAQDRVTLGLRYRTAPLRRRGTVLLGGVGTLCRPEPAPPGSTLGDIPACTDAGTVAAELSQRLPREIALGGSFVLGRSKSWRVDVNLYWLDLCPGGLKPGECGNRSAQVLQLLGLDQDSHLQQEFVRYRGHQDVYGTDVYGTWHARSNLSLNFGGHLASPAVRPDSLTAADNEGWRLGVTLGVTLRMGQSDFLLVPGYGLDTLLPVRISPSSAAFVPAARWEFERDGGDLNTDRADLVLQGRGRASNAGHYFGLVHTFSLAVRWAERGRALN